jgi:hypothetical protein
MTARQGTPNARYTYHDYLAGEVNFTADAKGVVRPRNADEERVADALGLPPIEDKQPAPKEAD